jgi:phospholipid/cholesterol/gamma-HCH transport system substrate-binding protein
MSPAFTPPVRFSRLVLKVNAFLLVALLLVAAFLGLVAHKQGWFVHQTTIHFLTPNALGINQGMPVKLYGLTVGSVRRMDLTLGGVDVQLSILSDHLWRMPKGSQAKFAREASVVGASSIEIIPAKSGPPLAEGDLIAFERSRSLAEVIEEIRRQTVPAFNELKQVLSHLNRSSEDVSVVLAALRAEAERLPATHLALQELLKEGARTTVRVGREASATLAAAQRASESAERATDRVGEAVPELTGRLGRTLESIDAAATELRRTSEQAQDVLTRTQPVVERGESALKEASEVMGAAKRVWPLSDSFTPPAGAMLAIDSFEANGDAGHK